MRSIEWTLRVLVGVIGLALTSIALGIFLSDGPTVSGGRACLYGVPILAVGLLGLWLTRVRRSRLILVSINGGTAVAALLGAELYLSVDRSSPQTVAVRSPQTIAAELRNAGTHAYPQVCPSMLADEPLAGPDGSVLLPLGGLSNNLLISLDGREVVTRHSDERGFNNPEGQWPTGGVEILAVGDSFTFGADVPFGHSFVDLMRAKAGITVNLGCGGNGPLSELAALVEYGPMLRPQIVIWAYYEGNDLIKDLGRELRSPVLMRYLEGDFSQKLANRQGEVDSVLMNFIEPLLAKLGEAATTEIARSPTAFSDIVRLTQLRTSMRLTCGFDRRRFQLVCDFDDALFARFSDILETAAKRVEAWNGRLVFVYLPGAARYASWIANVDADGSRNAVLRVVDELEIEHVDIHEKFLQHANTRSLFAGHYSKEGNALVADAILAKLQSKRLLE